MELKDFLKTTEALIVLTGLTLTVFWGDFWAIATAVAYTLLNVPKLVAKLKLWYSEIFKT